MSGYALSQLIVDENSSYRGLARSARPDHEHDFGIEQPQMLAYGVEALPDALLWLAFRPPCPSHMLKCTE